MGESVGVSDRDSRALSGMIMHHALHNNTPATESFTDAGCCCEITAISCAVMMVMVMVMENDDGCGC